MQEVRTTLEELVNSKSGLKQELDSIVSKEISDFNEFKNSVNEFVQETELAKKAYDLFKSKKWILLEELIQENNLNGGYPPNQGSFNVEEIILNAGKEIDRYGGWIDENGIFRDKGKFVSPKGISFESRSLKSKGIYNVYEVIKPIKMVKKATVIPWYGKVGLGIQYELPANIEDLIKNGYLKLK